MKKLSKDEIDAEILNGAAAIFAKHGFARTSLQQIADALNYTNAGLLHYYSSKKALYDAAIEKFTEQAIERFTSIEDVPAGIERDKAFVETFADFAFRWPGMTALGERLVLEDAGVNPSFVRMSLKSAAVMGLDPTAPDPERMLRVFNTMVGLNQAARLAAPNKLPALRAHMFTVAMNTLGHHGEALKR